jgi:feruloyl-CoA synthase
MTEPPSIDKGEITDKGYVNQRMTQDCRADLVDSLFVDTPPPNVVQL